MISEICFVKRNVDHSFHRKEPDEPLIKNDIVSAFHPPIPRDRSAQDARAKQIKVSPPIHLPFQEFEARVICPSYPPLIQGKRQRCFLDGSIVPPGYPLKQPGVLTEEPLASPVEPEPVGVPLLDHLHKVLSQPIEFP